MKTHIMIGNVSLPGNGHPILKKGDEVTLIEATFHPNLLSRTAYEFKEDEGMYYCASLFAPIAKKPDNALSSEELEQFIKERTQEKPDIVKKPELV